MPTEAIQISKKEYGKTSCQGTRSYVSQSFHAMEKAKKEEELKRKKKKKKQLNQFLFQKEKRNWKTDRSVRSLLFFFICFLIEK